MTSMCALGATFYQAYLQRKQQYASVWPYLMAASNNVNVQQNGVSVPHFEFAIANKGVGPAIIRDVNIWYKDSLLTDANGRLSVLLDHAVPDRAGLDSLSEVVNSNLWPGRIISADETVTWIALTGPLATTFQEIDRADIKIRIRYASVYDEAWLLNLNVPNEPTNVRLTD